MVPRKRVVVVILSVVLLLLLGVDFLRWEPRQHVTKQFSTTGSRPDFTASLSILGMAFDDRTESATATLELEIKTISKGRDIDRVTYGYQDNPDGTTSNLV